MNCVTNLKRLLFPSLTSITVARFNPAVHHKHAEAGPGSRGTMSPANSVSKPREL